MTEEHKDLTVEEIDCLLAAHCDGDTRDGLDVALRMARRCAEAEQASKGDLERTAKAIHLVADAQKRADEWRHLAEEWEATTRKAMARCQELEHEKTEAFVRLAAVKCDSRRQERVAIAAEQSPVWVMKWDNLEKKYQDMTTPKEFVAVNSQEFADAVLAQLDRTEKEVKPDAK